MGVDATPQPADEAIACLVAAASRYTAEGLAAALAAEPGFAVTARASAVADARRLLEDAPFDAVVGAFGDVDAAGPLLAQVAGTPVVLLCDDAEPASAARAVRDGVLALAPSDTSAAELAGILRQAVAGWTSIPAVWAMPMAALAAGVSSEDGAADEVRLTPREQQVVELVARGMSNKGLAHVLGIAPETAKNHVHNAMAKVGAGSRLQLCTWALSRGYGPRAQRLDDVQPCSREARDAGP